MIIMYYLQTATRILPAPMFCFGQNRMSLIASSNLYIKATAITRLKMQAPDSILVLPITVLRQALMSSFPHPLHYGKCFLTAPAPIIWYRTALQPVLWIYIQEFLERERTQISGVTTSAKLNVGNCSNLRFKKYRQDSSKSCLYFYFLQLFILVFFFPGSLTNNISWSGFNLHVNLANIFTQYTKAD